jgi:hypothetical protein
VTITGTNFGSGTDITRVRLGDVAATIRSQTATNVVIRTPAVTVPGDYDIVITSTMFGVTTRTAGWVYTGALQNRSVPECGSDNV